MQRFIWILLLLLISIPSFADDYTIYCITGNSGVLISRNNGRSWRSSNNGLPETIVPVKLYGDSKYIYLATYRSGIFKRGRNSNTWYSINTLDFKRRSIYKKNPGYRKISAFASDQENVNNLVLATKHTIYRSYNGGKSWKRLPMRGIRRRNYITALAIQGNTIIAGTSFSGIYILKNGIFRQRNSGLPNEPYSRDRSFTEQISAISFYRNKLFTGTEFGKGIYTIATNGGRWHKIPLSLTNLSSIHDVQKSEKNLIVSNGSNISFRSHSTSQWQSFPLHRFVRSIPKHDNPLGILITGSQENIPQLYINLDSNLRVKNSTANNKRAIYASVPVIRRNLRGVINTIKRSNLNAVVIDMKDDFGYLYFPTKNRAAYDIGAARRPLKIKRLIQKLHSHNIYVIARIVVFKDQRIYKGYKNKYSIKNRRTGNPWRGNELEYWVDPHSRFVHSYTIDISKELQKLGFDEIQYDYIRFPSDGAIGLCYYSYRTDRDTYKSEILGDFLWKAKQSLHIPVSVDIYGFNSWYHFGNLIGQDIEEFSHIVDVISPMVYPSHFGSRFYMKGKRAMRPYKIVHDGGVRALRLVRNDVIIRPYLQAFKMMSPTWGPGYISNQVSGSERSGCNGYIFWNAGGKYRMVERALSK